MNESTLVIACGAIAHELVAVTRASHFGALEIQCLPAEWHNTPERIAPAIEEKIRQAKAHHAHILVAYGDCGTGGKLDRVLERYQVSRLPGDHCYSFFTGRELFDAMAENELGTFYLTDYLVDNFERLVVQGLGIDRHPELRTQYFAHYTRVLYLAQDATRRERLDKAAEAAAALELPLQVHHTGLKPFTHAMRTISVRAA